MTDALVIGGSSQIGVAIGRTLAALGHHVTLWGRDPDRLELAAGQIRADGGRAGSLVVDVSDRGVKVTLIAPGLVAAGAGLRSPQGQADPGQLLQPEDIAAAVRFVVSFPDRGCPTEIRLEPQRG